MRPTHPDECSCAGRRVARLRVADPVHKARLHPSHSPLAANANRITGEVLVCTRREVVTSLVDGYRRCLHVQASRQ